MSYYCKGNKCLRKDECLRYKAYQNFPAKETKEGDASGIWYVIEPLCIKENYKEGVFKNT